MFWQLFSKKNISLFDKKKWKNICISREKALSLWWEQKSHPHSLNKK